MILTNAIGKFKLNRMIRTDARQLNKRINDLQREHDAAIKKAKGAAEVAMLDEKLARKVAEIEAQRDDLIEKSMLADDGMAREKARDQAAVEVACLKVKADEAAFIAALEASMGKVAE